MMDWNIQLKCWQKFSEFKLVTDNPFMKDEGIEGRFVTTIDCLCMRIIVLFLDLGFHASQLLLTSHN